MWDGYGEWLVVVPIVGAPGLEFTVRELDKGKMTARIGCYLLIEVIVLDRKKSTSNRGRCDAVDDGAR